MPFQDHSLVPEKKKKKAKATYVHPAAGTAWHLPWLAGGVCWTETGNGGTRLAFGVTHFQSWHCRPGTRRVAPAGGPARARWRYRSRACGVHPFELRRSGPRPHSAPGTGFAVLLKGTQTGLVLSMLWGTKRVGKRERLRGGWREGSSRRDTYRRGLAGEQAQSCREQESPGPYK